MAMSFSALMSALCANEDRYSITIPDDWMQGRTTYGGLSAALCLEVAQRQFPDLPALRSALIAFAGPAGGTVTGEARLLRRGKSVSFVEADILGEKGLATRATFGFGGARPSQLSFLNQPAPDVPDPESSGDFFPGGVGPGFARHFDLRLAKGSLPFTRANEKDHYFWVRHRDADADSIVAFLAMADMPPPAVMPMFDAPAPLSTMTWMVNMLDSQPATREGWWLLQSRAENAGDGYTSQDMTIWNFDRTPVATGRQSIAIFV